MIWIPISVILLSTNDNYFNFNLDRSDIESSEI
jgi:hypothetical protein